MFVLAMVLATVIFFALCGALYLMFSTLFKGPRKWLWTSLAVAATLTVCAVLVLANIPPPDTILNIGAWTLMLGAAALFSVCTAIAAAVRLVFFHTDSPASRRDSKWVLSIAILTAVIAGIAAYLFS